MIRNGNISDSRRVDLDGLSLESVAEVLAEASEGLTDVRLNIEMAWSYGDQFIHQYVSGWRPATAAEIEAHDNEVRRHADAERERQERTFVQLKQERPDLF